MFLAYGARIGYWRGSIEGMIDDLGVRSVILFWLPVCATQDQPKSCRLAQDALLNPIGNTLCTI